MAWTDLFANYSGANALGNSAALDINANNVDPNSVGSVGNVNLSGVMPEGDSLGFGTLNNSAFQNDINSIVNPTTSALGDQTNNFLTNPDTWRNIGTGVSAVSGLANTFLGFQNLGVARDQLAFQKDAFWAQFAEQQQDRADSAARREASATGVSQYNK